jgi:hypothetical protein
MGCWSCIGYPRHLLVVRLALSSLRLHMRYCFVLMNVALYQKPITLVQVAAASIRANCNLRPCGGGVRLTNSGSRSGAGSDCRLAAPPLSLDTDEHALVISKRQASLLPGVKVLAGGDGPTDMALRSDGPVLRKGRGADNRWCVHTPLHPDFVGGAIRLERAVARRILIIGRMMDAKVLNYVVLDQRVCGPAVKSEIRVPIGSRLVEEREKSEEACFAYV